MQGSKSVTANVTVNAPVAFSVILLQLVQAVKVKVRSRVRQPVQRVRLKAVTQPGGAWGWSTTWETSEKLETFASSVFFF